MPIIFVMFAAAALAGMLTQSPALRAQTPRMITAAYHFANHWLRILMGISIAWPTILILVALIEGSRTVVLVLTFFPIAAAIYAAIVIPPAIWFAPTIVNSILGTTGKVTTGLVGVLPKRLRGGAIQTPKLPTVRQLLWPVAAGLIGNCLLGLFLYWVPIAKDRELMFILLLVLIPFALLSVFGKAKKLRGLMIFASAVLVLIFFLGGRGEAQKKVESKASKLTNLISAAINDRPSRSIRSRRRLRRLRIGRAGKTKAIPATRWRAPAIRLARALHSVCMRDVSRSLFRLTTTNGDSSLMAPPLMGSGSRSVAARGSCSRSRSIAISMPAAAGPPPLRAAMV